MRCGAPKIATGKNRTERKQCNATERRVVILDQDKCKPKSAAFSYLRKHAGGCGKDCIHLAGTAEAPVIAISELACAACILRASKCPNNAVRLVKVPTSLSKNMTHKFGLNGFTLCGLPSPICGQVLGILGTNGIGKSTALQVLSGELKPNLGNHVEPPGWEQIIKYFRGSSLQNYLRKLANDELRAVVKPQRCKVVEDRTVAEELAHFDERGCLAQVSEQLELTNLLDRQLNMLSGGEQQRLAIARTCLQNADVYIFDEPCSFLDIKQRLQAVQLIQSLCSDAKYVIVVEHDLAMLDAISDKVCCLFGEPGGYGIVTPSSNPHQAINQFIEGYFPHLNMRSRAAPLDFAPPSVEREERMMAGEVLLDWQEQTFELHDQHSSFTLHVEPGAVRSGQVQGLLGQNGCGKSTLMNFLANHEGVITSLKPQMCASLRRQAGTVADLFESQIGRTLGDRMFNLLVLKPLQIERLMDCDLEVLSGGELQRVAITLCLGTPAQVYLLDEPSAGLDCEQRLVVARVIQKWVTQHLGQAAVVVEHDMLMASSLCSTMSCYTGTPGVECVAHSPVDVQAALNQFLGMLNVTVREDTATGRPRLNKRGGSKDREQKKQGTHYLSRSAQ